MKRIRVPELMDDPRLDTTLHNEALSGLETLNRLSGTSLVLWSELKSISPRVDSSAVRVLDIATGRGDILQKLSGLAGASGKRFEFVGADISDSALSFAEKNARENSGVSFIRLNAIEEEIPTGFDVVMTSLFTHHLDPDEVVLLFGRVLTSSARVLLVNDLVRTRLSYSLVWLASRLCTRSPVVHFDAPVSVNASYTPKEMRDMALKAGLTDCQVRPHPPCRQLLVWKRP